MVTSSPKSCAVPVILFLGAPGSGKGTQSSWLSGELGISCLSTGEMLRSEARANTARGMELRRTLASGSLVGDAAVCSIVESHLRRAFAPGGSGGAILDGFPRTVNQAMFLDSLLVELGQAPPEVLHLDISTEGLVRRLTARRQCAACGAVYNLASRPSSRGSRCERDGGALILRDDDSESVVLRRIAEFEKMSAPLIDYYRGRGYHRIDGDGDLQAISEDLLNAIIPARMVAAA